MPPGPTKNLEGKKLGVSSGPPTFPSGHGRDIGVHEREGDDRGETDPTSGTGTSAHLIIRVHSRSSSSAVLWPRGQEDEESNLRARLHPNRRGRARVGPDKDGSPRPRVSPTPGVPPSRPRRAGAGRSSSSLGGALGGEPVTALGLRGRGRGR